jgi:signal peptidase I
MAEDRARAKSAFGRASSVLLAVLSVVAVVLVVFGFLARPGKDGISRVGGHPVLTVLSGSMVPVFNPGDMVVDDRIRSGMANRLAAGDVITFHVAGSSAQLITHRIVAVKRVSHPTSPLDSVVYVTKGDANNAADVNTVAPSQVVGTYARRVPFGGYVLQSVQKKTIFFFIILIPLLYLIGSALTKR